MLESVSFLNSVSELSKAEKDIQTSLKFGKDFSDVEGELIQKAQEEILCSDWCLWREIRSEPMQYHRIDKFEPDVFTRIEVSGHLFHMGNEWCAQLVSFVSHYHHVFNMTWEHSPPMYGYGINGLPVSQSSLDIISFSSTFFFENSTKTLQQRYVEFLKGHRGNFGVNGLHKPWT